MKLILKGKPLINGIISYVGKKRKCLVKKKKFFQKNHLNNRISSFVLAALKMHYHKHQASSFSAASNHTPVHTHESLVSDSIAMISIEGGIFPSPQ